MPFRKDKAPVPAARSVLFVCMGNICRSPTAEAVFRATAQREGIAHHLFIDSAGTGNWHVGEAPDRRAAAAAQKRGYDMNSKRGRQVSEEDFARFGWIFAMDEDNLRRLEELRPPAFEGHLGLFLDLLDDADVREVPDPYYGGPQGFEHVLDLIERASEALIARLRSRLEIE
ncbi:MAG TPA: low molecular weight protein-tyrosine-phosphatase [Casimicrobiaceae bacterium]|nr:low molecular weight protein-tyrosine-phosphatase [Casimicrobiaceae bacterium]